jgi:hypothetical protein
MSTMPRRVSVGKILGILLLATVGCVVGLWLWVRSAIDRGWSDFEKKVHALHAEARARSGLRPLLRGEPHPGSAWEAYDEAIQATRGVKEVRALEDSLDGFPWSDPATVQAQLKLYAPALIPLRRGTQRSDGQRYRDWQHAETPKPTGPLVYLALCQAESLAAAGKVREAAELALDVVQFCCDAGRNGSHEDTADADGQRRIALSVLKDLILSRAMSGTELSEVERELQALEQSLPRLREPLVNSAMDQGFMFLDVGSKKSLLNSGDGKVSWRYLFSEQVLIAAAFESVLECMRSLAAADEKPWVESREIQKSALAELASTPNPLLKRYSGWVPAVSESLLRARREQQAQIRLLRSAAHYRAQGEILELEDPFAGKLLHRSAGTRLRLWSVGKDGIDDGGSGEWDAYKGKDIVLEVER